MNLADRVLAAVRASALAEVAWRDRDGSLHAAAVTPLLLDERPALALPFSRTGLAEALAQAAVVRLVVSDGRLVGRGWQPLVAGIRVSVTADPEGEVFVERLLPGLLAKEPASRGLLDSPLLRREHWWFVPRWLVTAEVLDVAEIGPRDGPAQGLLVTRDAVDTVAVADWDDDRPRLRSLLDHPLPQGRALLFTHDADLPDRERDTVMLVTGRLAGGRLDVEHRSGSRNLPPPLGLLGRLRRHRDLSRRCRRELAAAMEGTVSRGAGPRP